MSRVAGQTPTGKRITGTVDIRTADILTVYSEGLYGAGDYSNTIAAGMSGRIRSTRITGGRR